ncbi:hypothetical protein BC941DRAFT_512879 [Chlamydoabsidia padenii]|nr:hypothetical protein BC941DRAFT_512879 [Chlamydoabsidia padenii]
MEEDQEICRVCRCESTVQNPLYHPCKCSGSIRFVHQDCLLKWLSHSRKKYCELCEHPFLFTPIYRQDMPTHIPLYLLTGQCIARCGTILKTGLRALIVTIVWLVLLPYMTLWSWRVYFGTNSDNIHGGDPFSGETSHSFLEHSYNYGLWEFLVDCFNGQVITLVVILVVATMYIFKEWVAQNTPMVTEEEQLDQDPEDTLEQQDTLSTLAQQQVAMNVLIMAFDKISNTATDDKKDPKRQLEDLQRDLQLELDKQQQQNDRQPHSGHAHQQDESDGDELLNNDSYQLGNEEEDEAQVQDMMHSIMIQDPKNACKRYSWDDLQKSSNNTYLKRDNLGSSPPIPTLIPASTIVTTDSPSSIISGTQHASAVKVETKLRQCELFDHSKPSNPQQKGGRSGSLVDKCGNSDNSDSCNGILSWSLTPSLAITQKDHIDNTLNKDTNPCNNNDNADTDGAHALAALNDNNLDDDDDDDEGIFHLGNDIDGVFETIGMQGSPWMLLQNSILVFIIISLSLGVAVWLPYTLGRWIILVRPIGFTGKTMDTLRALTDPVVDYILDHCLPTSFVTTLVRLCVPENIHSGNNNNNNTLASLMQRESLTSSQQVPSINTNHLYSLVGERLYIMIEWTLARWHQFAVGTSVLDRGMCILVGYIIFLLAWAQYDRQCSNGWYRKPNSIIRQQCLFFKILFFVVMERCALPVFCGALVYMATWSWHTSTGWASSHPLYSALFYWVVGQCFLSQWGTLIDLCSHIVRPGVMPFLCHQYRHYALQDIMEQPLWILICDLGGAALAYLTIIGLGLGTVVWITSQYADIRPLKWLFSVPLSTLAIGVLAAQFILPILALYIKPRDVFKQAMLLWWQAVSYQLGLSSFMFGDSQQGHTSKAYGLQSTLPFEHDGQWVRVPERNDIKTRQIVPVDPATLLPLDPTSATMGEEQGATDVVYIPPHFKARMALFLILLWVSVSTLACSLTMAPVLLGRSLIDTLLAPSSINDLYAFVVGTSVIVLSVLFMMGMRYVKDRPDGLLPCVQQKTLAACKVIYMILTIGCVTPLLVGIAVDLYILIPIQSNHQWDLTGDWTLGVVTLGIMHGNMSPWQQRRDGLDHWTRTTVGPWLLVLCGAITVPGGLAWVMMQLIGIHDASTKVMVFSYVYPLMLCLAAACGVVIMMMKLVSLWMRIVKDDAYLVGRQLHNLDVVD